MSKINLKSIPLPDLRFEQTFMKNLREYANDKPKPNINESQIDLLNKQIDIEEEQELNSALPIISPSIVTYAIIKDQILMPLLQGFVWSGILILSRPLLVILVNHGQRLGTSLANLIGINQVLRSGSMRH